MQLTEEQQTIIHSPAKELVVNAFAGTGKTSTLIEYAKERPQESILYLAFNKSVKEEASERFPRNVRCLTTHGLAYREFGVPYKDKLGQPKAASIAKMFKCNYMVANLAVETLLNYFYSQDRELLHSHVPKDGVHENTIDLCLHKAKEIWEQMKNTSNIYVRMPHDGYLKLYQLSQPKLHFNTIMVDEMQDSNLLILDILKRQHSNKVYVGDRNQAIYGFRKAIDALDLVPADEKLSLTSSFRFGSGIASLATLLLKDWRGEPESIIGRGSSRTNFSVNHSRPHTILGRTNSGLFDAAVTALHSGHPFGFLGGYEGYRLDMILDAYKLKKNLGNITDPTVLLFQSFLDLENYAQTVDDKELKMLIRTIDKYGAEVPYLIEQLKARSKPNNQLSNEDIILSTAHKSKGMEFNSVILLDDYTDLKITLGDKGQEIAPSIEDINILYVAMTRAISNIELNEKTIEWLDDLDMTMKVQRGDSMTHFQGTHNT